MSTKAVEAQEWVRDVGIVLRASWAVSSSPPMKGYPEYVARVRATRRSGENPGAKEMLAGIERVVQVGSGRASTGPTPRDSDQVGSGRVSTGPTPRDWLVLPW